MTLKEEYSEEQAEEWVIEVWVEVKWVRDYQTWYKWNHKSLFGNTPRKEEVKCEFPFMTLQEAMEVTKYRSKNRTNQANRHWVYRIRNTRTGDIIPEALL